MCPPHRTEVDLNPGKPVLYTCFFLVFGGVCVSDGISLVTELAATNGRCSTSGSTAAS